MKEPIYLFAQMKVIPWYRKKSSGTGRISLRIVIHNRRSEFATGIEVSKADFVKGKFTATHTGQEAKELVGLMTAAAKRINQILFDDNRESTAVVIKDVLCHLRDCGYVNRFQFPIKRDDVIAALTVSEPAEAAPIVKRASLMNVAEALKEYLEIEGSTLLRYKAAELCLYEYLCRIKKPDMAAEDFTEADALLMTDYLRKTRKKPLARVTIKLYMAQHVRALKEAKRRGIIKTNPLAEFEYEGKAEKDHRNLTTAQVMELYTLPDLTPKMEELRDAFLFMVWTGMHYIDYITLTKDHITRKDEYNEATKETKVVWWLEKPRQKTDVEFCQKLDPFALQIIAKYGTVEALPRFQYNWMRKHLKILGKMTTLKFDLLSKMGRKTKADTLLNRRSKPVSKETAAKVLGMNTTTTIDFYAKVGRERVEREMND